MLTLFVWGNTRLRIRQIIEATICRLTYIDPDGRRLVRYKVAP